MDGDSGPAGRVQSSSSDSEQMRGQNSTRQEHDRDDHHTITSRPAAAPFLVVVAKLAAFTDVLLSGLIFPILPTILDTRAQVPRSQVQIWTSVLVSAYGGAFAVLSPLMPLLTRQGLSACIVLIAGLAAAATAFALLQFSDNLWLWILARVVHGFGAAAVVAASSGIFAATSSALPAWISPSFLQNVAMTTGPVMTGALHEYYGQDWIFYAAYGLIALNMLFSILAASLAPSPIAGTPEERTALLDSESSPASYGTLSAHGSHSDDRSPRSLSPTAPEPRSAQHPPSVADTVHCGPRALLAWSGYLVLGLLVSALHSVLPHFTQTHLHWSVWSSAFSFVPLSAPAVVTGPLSGALASRAPKSIRFLVTTGFIALVPAFLALGQASVKQDPSHQCFFLVLGIISVAAGLSAEPLLRELSAATSSSSAQSWSSTAHAAVLPTSASAWGTLAGPLLAGAVSWLWGWNAMAQSMAVVAAGSGVLSLLFLQGWIGKPYAETRSSFVNSRTLDEESAPLITNSRSACVASTDIYHSKPEGYHAQRRDSDEVSPHTRTDQCSKSRPNRRHFSVDNFSIATTAAGSIDSSGSSVRFQAALETPVPPPRNGGRRRSEASDTTTKSSAERRYVMREAPHAPATDPLLAAGSLYVIDEERDTATGVETARQKRRVVVFPEGAAPPELLAKHRHHVVAINALDGTAQMVVDSTNNHAVHVTEEEDEPPAFSDANSRRYVVIVVEGEGDEVNGGAE
ncbi:hypothetical protein VTJ04DRAFT_7369 [Mycothermus thermophilus]|uniref:uncharacterized protein n=1 Tax=Humicola insolens TaxID=85995 RepID=UPI0037426515